MLTNDVPSEGPLRIGSVYKRAQLHDRFGGNRVAGIMPSNREPVVLLFHTDEPTQQFYHDGFDASGVYWYSGEGQTGDMSWTSANRAVRDHELQARDLLLFERVRRQERLWVFSHVMQYIEHRVVARDDKSGHQRNAIVFALLPIDNADVPFDLRGLSGKNLAELRLAAIGRESVHGTLEERIAASRHRSQAVRLYALARADGTCEACERAAPFTSASGAPFLEVHHIDRLCDHGPDRIDHVAAVCPNCHRRCHYAVDAGQYNASLRNIVSELEARLARAHASG